MKTYIAGPISGRTQPEYQEHFARAAEHLLSLGLIPVSPLSVPAVEHPGDCPPGYAAGEGSGHSSACHMRADLRELMSCEAIYLLGGWEESRGANVEKAVAEACGMDVIYEGAAS